MLGWASDRTAKQMGDAFLQDRAGGPTDRLEIALGFEVLVPIRRGERRVATKVNPNASRLVTFDHRHCERCQYSRGP